MKVCLPLQNTQQFNVSGCQWFCRYWIFAVWKKSFGYFYSSKCSLCVQYILQYIQNLYFVSFCCVQLVAFCGFLDPFLRIFQHFYLMQPPIFPPFFCQFLDIFSLPLVSFFVLFCNVSAQPLSSFCSFILVKVVFIFLNFSFNFCLFQPYVIVINLCQ